MLTEMIGFTKILNKKKKTNKQVNNHKTRGNEMQNVNRFLIDYAKEGGVNRLWQTWGQDGCFDSYLHLSIYLPARPVFGISVPPDTPDTHTNTHTHAGGGLMRKAKQI